jgi:hypothetical protein
MCLDIVSHSWNRPKRGSRINYKSFSLYKGKLYSPICNTQRRLRVGRWLKARASRGVEDYIVGWHSCSDQKKTQEHWARWIDNIPPRVTRAVEVKGFYAAGLQYGCEVWVSLWMRILPTNHPANKGLNR